MNDASQFDFEKEPKRNGKGLFFLLGGIAVLVLLGVVIWQLRGMNPAEAPMTADTTGSVAETAAVQPVAPEPAPALPQEPSAVPVPDS